MKTEEIVEWMRQNPIYTKKIIRDFLMDDTITIAELIELKESAIRRVIDSKKEDLSQAYALLIRYKAGINKKTLDSDTERFLDNCSYTGLSLKK